jgi:hypothetical protein
LYTIQTIAAQRSYVAARELHNRFIVFAYDTPIDIGCTDAEERLMEPQNDHNHQHHHRGRRNKIAWIALAVGLLALGFAAGSRHSSANNGFPGQRGPMMGWQQNGPPQWQQGQAPTMPQPPQAAQPPQNQAGPGNAQGRQHGPMMGFQQGQQGFGRSPMMGQRGPGGMFGMIFGMISGLFKLAFWGIALFLIVKVLRDRRGGHGDKGGDQTASRPGPEQPPYTGHTTNL